MAERGEEIFIGRQPILGRSHELFAYELLFRSGRQKNTAEVQDDLLASASVISHAFADLGVEQALRRLPCRAFAQIGRLAFEAARADAAAVWAGAQPDWDAELTTHSVEIPLQLPGLGHITLVDEIRTRGGVAVTVTASTGDEQIIRPWVESLALAAAGHAAPARLHRLVNHFGQLRPETRGFPEVEAAEAVTRLTPLAHAYVLGQHRLVAVPAAPAIAYAWDVEHGNLDPADWRGPFRGYHRKWAWPGRAWELFFDSDVSELCDDVPLPEDPQTQPSAFAAWALAMYQPLVRNHG